jgi:gas vesicle protein
MNSTIKYLGVFITGIALGVAAGVLMAPESGEKTRKKLLSESKKLRDKFSESLSQGIDELKSNYNKKVDEYARVGKGKIEEGKDTLKL